MEQITARIPASSILPCSPRGRVLIVDDEPMVLRAMQRWLSGAYDVSVATSATEAHRLVASGAEYDVILCDLMMPKMTGMQWYGELARAFPAHAERVIFLSGGAFTHAVQAFLDGLTNTRLDKPVDGQALRELIARRVRAVLHVGGAECHR